jgi:O-antigen ligase
MLSFIILILVILGVNFLRADITFYLQNTSMYARLMDYQNALNKIKSRPILGYGPENFRTLSVSREMSLAERKIDPRPADRVHNIFLDTMINIGFIGLLVYLLLWIKIMLITFVGLQRKNKDFILLGGLFLAYFVWANLNFDFIFSLAFFYLCLVGLKLLSDFENIEE